MSRNSCANCNALCCRKLIVEASSTDVLREPRIAEKWPRNKMWDGEPDPIWSINGNCPFLRADAACTIYATRPDECRGFQVDGQHCCDLRGMPVVELVEPSGR